MRTASSLLLLLCLGCGAKPAEPPREIEPVAARSKPAPPTVTSSAPEPAPAVEDEDVWRVTRQILGADLQGNRWTADIFGESASWDWRIEMRCNGRPSGIIADVFSRHVPSLCLACWPGMTFVVGTWEAGWGIGYQRWCKTWFLVNDKTVEEVQSFTSCGYVFWECLPYQPDIGVAWYPLAGRRPRILLESTTGCTVGLVSQNGPDVTFSATCELRWCDHARKFVPVDGNAYTRLYAVWECRTDALVELHRPELAAFVRSCGPDPRPWLYELWADCESPGSRSIIESMIAAETFRRG